MIELKLTEPEANTMAQMIDIAVKATGIGGAEAGLMLARKLHEAHAASQRVVADVPPPAAE